MKEKKEIMIKEKNLDKHMYYTLLELITYYNLSYPVGYHDQCQVLLDDAQSKIITDDIVYKIDNSLYVKLYLLSNKVISNIYKLISEDLML